MTWKSGIKRDQKVGLDLLSASQAGRLGIEVDDAGNVVVGDPRRAKVLVAAHRTTCSAATTPRSGVRAWRP